jgi:hypothetical protein
MSATDLTASLVASLAWPICLLSLIVLAWFNRKQLARFLNGYVIGQGRSIQRIKAGPIEVEWEKLVESTGNLVPDVSGVIAKDNKYVLDLRSITWTDKDPIMAVFQAFDVVVSALSRVVWKANKYDTKNLSFDELRKYALNGRFISYDTFLALGDLMELRNQAAHRVGEMDITRVHANQFVKLAERIVQHLAGR